jgi:hypothetical protein
MTVQEFESHDSGYEELLGSGDWESDDYAAVLLPNGGGSQDRATEVDWEDISADEISDADYSQQQLASKAVSGESTRVKFTHGKITFTSSGSISARYLYILKGTADSLANSDKILGHIDLSGSAENVSSVSGEFSFTPHSDGLFYIQRTAAP